MEGKQKILVCGDVLGNFKQFFNRLETINKKNGPFEFVLCVGEFFSPSVNGASELEAYRNGNKHVAVATYILGASSLATSLYFAGLPESGEFCPNLTFLGARGLYTVTSGIKIAYVSGVEKKRPAEEKSQHEFDDNDVHAVRNSCLVNKTSAGEYRGIDILLTSQWPQGIDDKASADGSKLLSWLAHEIRPRYHFCGMADTYFERLPYRNSVSDITNLETATRFISLASFNNAEKAKSIYALSLCSVDKMRLLELIQKTTTETSCPYDTMELMKSSNNQIDDAPQYFFDTNSQKRKIDDAENKNNSRNKKRVYDQDKCWFCLSSPSVEKHLVITVGEHFYLALAKGPINETHCLLLPVTHVQSSSLLSMDSWNELQRFKHSLAMMFKGENKLTSFFERNYRSSHLQINVLAVDAQLEWHIKNAFNETAEKYDLTLEELPPLKEACDLPDKGPYFVAELPDKTALFTRQMKMFPLHFGREAFCAEGVLNCPNKTEWKECELGHDQEVAMVKNLRVQFKHYFTS